MADTKTTDLTATTTATSDDVLYIVDGITSKQITFANVESSIDHDNITNTHNLTTDIDHDSLTNFSANEHIDWTLDQGATNIHSGNYTDTDTTDHTAFSNIGTNTHAQIDTHIADSTIHFTEGSITITASQVSDFDAEVSNNSSVTANTAKVSYTKTNVKGHVEHGATAGTTRPTGFTSVEWVGSVEPTNAVNGDTWIDTS